MFKTLTLAFFLLLPALTGLSQHAIDKGPDPNSPGISYGIVADNSGSLRPRLDSIIFTSQYFTRQNDRKKDETFITRFTGRQNIIMLQPMTADLHKLHNAAENFFPEGGQTAIIDALFASADYLVANAKKDTPRRLALVLISDGEQRDSVTNYDDLLKLLKEKNIRVYAIGLPEQVKKTSGKKAYEKAIAFLQKLAADTGARSYFPESDADVSKLTGEILDELRKP